MSAIVTVRQKPFSDFEVFARDAVQDNQIDIMQLDRGKMTGTITHLSAGSVGVSSGDFARGLRSSGVLSKHRRAFVAVLDAPARWLNFDAAPGDLLTLPPNHELYARYFTANHYAVTLIKPDDLDAFIEVMDPAALDAKVWRQSAALLTTDPATAIARNEDLRVLLAAMRKHGEVLPAGISDYYTRCLMDLTILPVLKGFKYRPPRPRSALALVRDIDRYFVEAGPRPVHISELCAEFSRSAPTVRNAFWDEHGMTPRQFQKQKLLGDAHTALLMAAPGDTVESIAIRFGFLHAGRFAKTYYLQFGEWPNETLRRPVPFSLMEGY